jgi:hypothetical protein
MYDPIVIDRSVTICPGKDAYGDQLSQITIKRGEETGTLILHKGGNLTLESVVLDGENTTVDGPLLRMTSSAGNLVLKNTTIQNHVSGHEGVFALDAVNTKTGSIRHFLRIESFRKLQKENIEIMRLHIVPYLVASCHYDIISYIQFSFP